jgi:GxxExxY protein
MAQESLNEQKKACSTAVQRCVELVTFECFYQNYLIIELRHQGPQSESNRRTEFYYQGQPVGDFIADILVEKSVRLELNAIENINSAYKTLPINHIHPDDLRIGFVLHLSAPQLEINRNHQQKSLPASLIPPATLSKKSSAFSLLELLVAIAVLCILLVILLDIVQGATNLWRTSENKVEAYREARAALQIISSDLRHALASTNTNFFRRDISSYPNSTNVAFLATLPLSSQETNSLSDICTVGYFLAYDNKSPVSGITGRHSYNLYRYFVESNETFAKLSDSSGPADVLDFDPSRQPEILARNVVGFNATYFITNGPGSFTTWTQSAATPMPDIVEIQLTAVNNERTMRFGARGASGEWDAFSGNTNSPDYLKNTKTFTTRINIP